jgi:hypothetical protein
MGNTSLWVRDKECGPWEKLISANNSGDNMIYDALCVGIISQSNNVELLVDDYYYNESGLDNVSYVNGSLTVVDKKTLSVLSKIHLDYKVCGLAKVKNRLIVTFLNGFNVYSVDNPVNPKLLYTYRPNTWVEYQGVDCFEKNGRCYALICTYSEGFVIIDLTDENSISLVKSFDFTSISNDTPLTQGLCYSFDVVVDYPFAYATVSTKHNYIGSINDYRGVVFIDLHDLYNPSMEFVEMPKDRLSLIKSGDPTPTRISKNGNRIVVNNCDYGVEVFNIGSGGKGSYVTGIEMPERCSSNALFLTSDGLLFIGDIGTNGSLYLYKGLR